MRVSDPPRHQQLSASFVVGRDRFARISAVEGIVLDQDMLEIMERFDRDGLGAAERRRVIIRRFTPKR